jgi:hypothetical protein
VRPTTLLNRFVPGISALSTVTAQVKVERSHKHVKMLLAPTRSVELNRFTDRNETFRNYPMNLSKEAP